MAHFLFHDELALPVQSFLLPANRLFAYYRGMYLFSGVSPVAPFLALTIGMYCWFWYSLHGQALFGPDRPRLPVKSDLEFPDSLDYEKRAKYLKMFSREDAEIIECTAKPLAKEVLAFAFVLLVLFRAVGFS
jgi:hypothetical protein